MCVQHLTPGQLRRSYQGKTQVLKSQVTVSLTVHIKRHRMLEDGVGGIKLNEPISQKFEKQNFWQQAKRLQLCSNLLKLRDLNFCVRSTYLPWDSLTQLVN